MAHLRLFVLYLILCPASGWATEAKLLPTPAVVPVKALPEIPAVVAAPVPGVARYRAIARSEALKADVPYDLVDAVMKIESDYRADQIGGVGEMGLMQVRPETAAMLGFTGLPGSLADPTINIHYGTTYLGKAWHLANGNVCRTLMKYRAGHGQEVMSSLSSTYCARAQAHLVAMDSPLAATITPADLVAAVLSPEPVTGLERGPHGRLRSGPKFWVSFQARIKKANARIEAKWKRVAAR